MPWMERETVSLRREFAMLAGQEGANIRELCRRFGISPPTGYKWLKRFHRGGIQELEDRSRRPTHSPGATAPVMEQAVLRLRDRHPAWGGRKLRVRLLNLGHREVPAASTITGILRRHGRLDPAESGKHTAWKRFEHPAPNCLWQMDFKGHFPMIHGRCHPLTILDDHSRYSMGLFACGDERSESVQMRLTGVFRRYGLPDRILADNGPPWGGVSDHGLTPLAAWLLRLGVGVGHGRPYHPQTQGKDERFHRTLQAEVIQYGRFANLRGCQRRFDDWREVYNHERPHEALDLKVPASRYRVSNRPYPELLPPIMYDSEDEVRTVQARGWLRYNGRDYRVPKALRGHPVALRPTETDGIMDVIFCHQTVTQIDLRSFGQET